MPRQDTDFIAGMFTGAAKCETALASGSKGKTFDWKKAARLIKKNGITNASAGLMEDWSYTSGHILQDGKPDVGYVYLNSMWATPILVDDDTDTEYECWVEGMGGPQDWTDEALKILQG